MFYRSLRWMAPALVTAVLLTASPAAFAYNVMRAGSTPLRWPAGSIPVRWYMNMNGFQGIPEASVEQCFKVSVQEWTAPSCTSLRTVYGGKTTSLNNTRDRRTVVVFVANWPHPAQALAVTTPAFTSTGQIFDADIAIQNTGRYSWSVQPTSSRQMDLQGVTTHEMGHMFGLQHSATRVATMYYSTTPGLSPQRKLHQDDINGICYLYPKAGHSCTSNAQCPEDQSCSSGSCGGSSSTGGAGSSCPTGKCNSGLLCLRGSTGSYCVAQCSGGTCADGTPCRQVQQYKVCVCQSSNECPSGKQCKGFRCTGGGTTPQCKSDADCPAGQICQSGSCVNKPPTGGDVGDECGSTGCKAGLMCVRLSVSGPAYCVAQCPNGSCPNGTPCQQGSQNGQTYRICVCSSDAQCPSGGKCTGLRCVGGTTGCTSDAQCGAGKVCQGGKCVNKPPTGCNSNADCPSGQICQNRACVNKPPPPKHQLGQNCGADAECDSGVCRNIPELGKKICTFACNSATHSPCPVGYKCVSTSAGAYCAPGARPATDGGATGKPDSGTAGDSSSTGTSGSGTWRHGNQDDGEGCSCSAGKEGLEGLLGTGLSLLALLLLLRALLRTRSRERR